MIPSIESFTHVNEILLGITGQPYPGRQQFSKENKFKENMEYVTQKSTIFLQFS